MSVSDPNAGVEGKASELQQQVINTFCSVNDNFDTNYQQIVGDYGLLVANSRMIERSESGATSYDTATDTAIAGFKQWVWQQFAGQDPSKNVQNWWVGYCTDGSSGCPWGPNDVGVWTAPENSNVTFRLVGQHKNGSEANCSWGAQNEIVNDTDKGQDPKDAWVDVFVAQPGNAGVGPPGAGVRLPAVDRQRGARPAGGLVGGLGHQRRAGLGPGDGEVQLMTSTSTSSRLVTRRPGMLRGCRPAAGRWPPAGEPGGSGGAPAARRPAHPGSDQGHPAERLGLLLAG